MDKKNFFVHPEILGCPKKTFQSTGKFPKGQKKSFNTSWNFGTGKKSFSGQR
jgi:hypothetical protein